MPPLTHTRSTQRTPRTPRLFTHEPSGDPRYRTPTRKVSLVTWSERGRGGQKGRHRLLTKYYVVLHSCTALSTRTPNYQR
eukprot:6924834-Prymnesium_polylepis.1